MYEGEFKDGLGNGQGEERGGRVRESSRAREDEGQGPAGQAAPTGGKAVRDAT